MPNLCTNTLIVACPNAETTHFIAAELQSSRHNSAIDFAATCPVTDDCIGAQECAWGTKCNAIGARLDLVYGSNIMYTFYTTETPPLHWLRQTSARFPAVCFDLAYDDQLLQFSGRYQCINGVPVQDEYYESE